MKIRKISYKPLLCLVFFSILYNLVGGGCYGKDWGCQQLNFVQLLNQLFAPSPRFASLHCGLCASIWHPLGREVLLGFHHIDHITILFQSFQQSLKLLLAQESAFAFLFLEMLFKGTVGNIIAIASFKVQADACARWWLDAIRLFCLFVLVLLTAIK